MLRITPKETGGQLTLHLEGKLAGPWVAELAEAWSQGRGRGSAATVIDLRDVWFIDESGRNLLTALHAEGAGLVGSGCYVGPIVQSILHGRQLGAAKLRFFWLPLVGLAAASALAAQEPRPLSLAQALEQALSRNPEVQASLLRVAQSQEDRRMAGGALLPGVEAGASFSRTKQNFDMLLGVATPGGPDVVGPFNAGQVGVSAEQPLFDLGLYHRWKAAEAGVGAAQAQARATREAIAALVVGQYLRCQRAAEAVKAAESRVQLAGALEELARHQQETGVGTKLDTLRAQVQQRTEQQRLIQARTQLRSAHYGLVKLLDLEPTTRLALTDPLNAVEAPGYTFQEAYGAGLRQRPELAALDARERAARNLRSAAEDLRLPSVVLTGSYASGGLSPNQPWVPIYQVAVGLKVPLFTGGRISAQTAKAKAELDLVAERRKDLKSQVGLEVQVAQAELEAARSEVEVAGQAQALAEEALTQARHRFEAGVANNIELINAQDELARATDNRISALYRLNQSRADLAKAMGQLEPLFAH